MAYSPSLVPTLSPQGATSDTLPSVTPNETSESDAAVAALREDLADGTKDLDAIFAAIAEAAHRLTDANATALAIRTGGAVTCRGRSGDLAPDLGTRLSVDSGISGECLRTGKVLRCDDAFKDFRADPEVCRRLGLRSIAAVPLRGARGTMGVLEAFSTRAYAFADEHMDALRQLAELAEQARVADIKPVAPPDTADSHTVAAHRLAVLSAALADARTTAVARSQDVVAFVRERIRNSRIRYALAVSAFILLLLLGVLVWRPWQKPATQASSPSSAPATQPEVAQPAAPDAKADLVWTPPAVAAAKRDSSSSVPDDVVRKVVPPPAPADASPQVQAAPPAVSPANASEEPPVYTASATKPLGNILAGPATIPQLTAPVSSGVTEGVLIRRVSPVYPQAAMPLRLEGAVVLKATITQDGKVRDVSAISGHPTLARAATDAVRQWRYRPYLLNGKPVPMETQITINFKLP